MIGQNGLRLGGEDRCCQEGAYEDRGIQDVTMREEEINKPTGNRLKPSKHLGNIGCHTVFSRHVVGTAMALLVRAGTRLIILA